MDMHTTVNNTTQTRTILHCALIAGIGDVTIGALCAALSPDRYAQLYDWSTSDFIERALLSAAQAQLLTDGLRDMALLDRELARIEKHQISWAVATDDRYPAALKTIYAPPSVLFWQGTSPALHTPVMAWVGSRAANRYARSVTNQFIPELVAAGWCIASGGALGADTMAHEAVLTAGGQTIAIIGAGLLRPYPATNKNLFERIIGAGGTVMSPFPLEMQAMPGNFPARNRIISGLSRAVVVVQAAEKSGARITALQALEQGREVCVIPGDIFDPLSAGCHRLLLEGATPVTSVTDLLRAVGSYVPTVNPVREKTIDRVAQKTIMVAGDQLLTLCREPRTFDDLLSLGGYTSLELQDRLFNLQLDGAVTQDFLGRFTAVP